MPKVSVFNDNIHPYTERFKGDDITIPAKGSIEMDWEEAVQFAGQMGRGIAPIGGDGRPDARYFKMIRVPYPVTPIIADDPLTNHATGQKSTSVEDLTEALKNFAGQKAPEVNTEVADLKSELAAQKALLQELLDERAAKKGK